MVPKYQLSRSAATPPRKPLRPLLGKSARLLYRGEKPQPTASAGSLGYLLLFITSKYFLDTLQRKRGTKQSFMLTTGSNPSLRVFMRQYPPGRLSVLRPIPPLQHFQTLLAPLVTRGHPTILNATTSLRQYHRAGGYRWTALQNVAYPCPEFRPEEGIFFIYHGP